MRVLPAIDIRGGRCVNLVQGDFAQETVFAADPVEQAKQWWADLKEGLVHIVDLDGAREGRCCVLDILSQLAALGIPYEVGGGIRSLEAIEAVLQAGAERVILGTAACRNPELVEEAAKRWPGRIVAGIDARDRAVAVQGWTEATAWDALDLAKEMVRRGVVRIVYTDITKDGMMQGPNFARTAELARETKVPVTLSGGIATLEDIRRARELEEFGVDEVIIGRALYLKRFTLQEAIQTARGET